MKTFIVVFLFLVFIQVIYLAVWPTDSTDFSRWRRSGLSVYHDKATGVQYVKAGLFGSLTPRLNEDGSLYVVNPPGN